MKKVLERTAYILAVLAISYFGGFFLAHWINDVLIAPDVIGWLSDAVYWFRNHFAPFIREPDDIEALYLLALLSICWLAVLAILLGVLTLVHRLRTRSHRKTASTIGK